MQQPQMNNYVQPNYQNQAKQARDPERARSNDQAVRQTKEMTNLITQVNQGQKPVGRDVVDQKDIENEKHHNVRRILPP